MNRSIGLLLMVGLLAGCGATANVDQERDTLMRLDKEWSGTAKDVNKFVSYYAADASVYPPGMPVATGSGPIHDVFATMTSAPDFALTFEANKAVVSSSGDVGYTTGAYQSTMNGETEKGKYVTIWKKQADGQWKAMEDIFNADSNGAPPVQNVMVQAASIAWADAPPFLPPGSKMAVISGDPSKPGPFVIRAQVPAGYKVPPHWHPGDENLTVLSGTIAMGMGDTWDESKMQSVAVGGYVGIPAQSHHSFLAKTAAVFQVHGMGPFAITYINPADDPSKKK